MQFTSNYDSRVVVYERKMFIRLATGLIIAYEINYDIYKIKH